MKHSQLDSYRELEKADDEINSALHRLEGEGAPSAPEIISMIFGNPFEIAVLGSLLHHIFPDAQIRRFESSTDWENEKSDASNIEIVLYNLGDRRISDPDVKTGHPDLAQRRLPRGLPRDRLRRLQLHPAQRRR